MALCLPVYCATHGEVPVIPKVLIAAVFAAGFTAAPARAQDAAPAGYASTFRLRGQVMHPQTYSLALLQALPATRQNVFFVAGSGTVNATYTGVLLWDLLNTAGLVENPAVKNDLLRQRVVVTGSDGYQAVFSLGELAPQFGGEQVMVAYAVNGQPLGASTGFAEVIAPGDKAGGRAVNTIVRIEVLGGGS